MHNAEIPIIAVDGVWGPQTEAALRAFQEDQLRLIHTILDTTQDASAHRAAPLEAIRDELVIEIAQGAAGDLTGSLLSEPLTDTSADELAGILNEPLTHAEALSSFNLLS